MYGNVRLRSRHVVMYDVERMYGTPGTSVCRTWVKRTDSYHVLRGVPAQHNTPSRHLAQRRRYSMRL